jgi:pimeloyl-ACP methyl ester carboxylesterase
MAMVILNGVEVHHEVYGPSDSDVAEHIEALVLPAGVERCHVVGTSFGGMVVLNLALRRPDLIDRLVTSPGGTHASCRFSDPDAMELDS